MPPELATTLAQCGVAGLIGWMWLTERRAAATRERQLTESHQTILEDRARLDILVAALEANTRAITALEVGQRQLASLIEMDLGARTAPPAPDPDDSTRPQVPQVRRLL